MSAFDNRYISKSNKFFDYLYPEVLLLIRNNMLYFKFVKNRDKILIFRGKLSCLLEIFLTLWLSIGF